MRRGNVRPNQARAIQRPGPGGLRFPDDVTEHLLLLLTALWVLSAPRE